MEIRIQAIHFDASEKLEKFIQKKVSKLEQYYDGIIAVEVSLKVKYQNRKRHRTKRLELRFLFREMRICFPARLPIPLKRRSIWLSRLSLSSF